MHAIPVLTIDERDARCAMRHPSRTHPVRIAHCELQPSGAALDLSASDHP